MLAANALFEQLNKQFVFVAHDRIRVCNIAANILFENALRITDLSCDDGIVRSVPVPAAEDSPPMVIHLVPIRGVAHDMFSRASLILIVTKVVRSSTFSADLLTGLFVLTASESKIALLIGSGHSPRIAAKILEISEETARTALKRVYSKVGVHRQSELVSLLAKRAPK